MLVAILAVPVVAWRGFLHAWKRHEESDAQKKSDAARPHIDAAKKRADAAMREVRAALTKADESKPSAEGPCPIHVPLPPEMNGQAKTSFDNGTAAVNAAVGGMAFLQNMTTVAQHDLPTLEAASPRDLARKAGSVEGSSTLESFLEDARKLDAIRLTWDLVLVREEWKPPLADEATHSFTPGRLKGRGYLYDHDKHAVVCAADVDATNSERVKFKLGEHIAATALFQDLDAEALRQAVERLAAVK